MENSGHKHIKASGRSGAFLFGGSYGNTNQQRNQKLHRKYVFWAERKAIYLLASLLAIGVAVGLYFGLQNHLCTETVSWLCILGAAPFAALGFLRYNGMPAEKCIAAFVRSELLMPKRLTFHPTNLYYEILQPTIRKHEKEVKKNHD